VLIDHIPIVGLRLSTPRLQLRLPDNDELAALADLAAAGIHDPAVMPFMSAWTDLPPAQRARSVIQQHWAALGALTAQRWALGFAVFADHTIVGVQELRARDFAVRREVSTGSWLARTHHGRGIGTEMRAAVLHLAFAGLGAQEAVSGAFADNVTSLAVSTKLGYQPDGIDRDMTRGAMAITCRLRLTRADWETHARVPVTIDGLAPCHAYLGAG
jgi:RimJ/RimL family protein N-acetyltransferase